MKTKKRNWRKLSTIPKDRIIEVRGVNDIYSGLKTYVVKWSEEWEAFNSTSGWLIVGITKWREVAEEDLPEATELFRRGEEIALELEAMVENQLPYYAKAKANGELVIGATLPTRDGRTVGNATIVDIEKRAWLDAEYTVYHCITDIGNKLRLSDYELIYLYHPTEWIITDEELMLRIECAERLKERSNLL